MLKFVQIGVCNPVVSEIIQQPWPSLHVVSLLPAVSIVVTHEWVSVSMHEWTRVAAVYLIVAEPSVIHPVVCGILYYLLVMIYVNTIENYTLIIKLIFVIVNTGGGQSER